LPLTAVGQPLTQLTRHGAAKFENLGTNLKGLPISWAQDYRLLGEVDFTLVNAVTNSLVTGKGINLVNKSF